MWRVDLLNFLDRHEDVLVVCKNRKEAQTTCCKVSSIIAHAKLGRYYHIDLRGAHIINLRTESTLRFSTESNYRRYAKFFSQVFRFSGNKGKEMVENEDY